MLNYRHTEMWKHGYMGKSLGYVDIQQYTGCFKSITAPPTEYMRNGTIVLCMACDNTFRCGLKATTYLHITAFNIVNCLSLKYQVR